MRLALPTLLAALSAVLVAAAPSPELSLGSNEGILPGLEKRSEALVERIVYNPPIIYPTADTIWIAGNTQRVEWLTGGIPPELRDYSGVLKLGYLVDGSLDEHLSITLAEDFPLGKGIVRFELPGDLASGDNYIVVLFGDSGNASPQFTIVGPGIDTDPGLPTGPGIEASAAA